MVGFLNATDFEYRVAMFHQGLEEFGYFEECCHRLSGLTAMKTLQ
jgi:hypothetical protein